jgi:hypothetical protein
MMNWDYIQENKDDILKEGLNIIKEQKEVSYLEFNSFNRGNYILFKDDIYFYIGEAKNISNRLKDHFNINKSSFYKEYIKMGFPKTDIDSFKVKYLEVNIVRKELEEFGMNEKIDLIDNSFRGNTISKGFFKAIKLLDLKTKKDIISLCSEINSWKIKQEKDI